MSDSPANIEDLIQLAKAARKHAYAPYSGYTVGAIVVDEKGFRHPGVNVENVAYGSTICAERAAILRMVADGGTRIEAIVLSTSDGGTPCGACLQVIREFAGPSTPIVLAGDSSPLTSTTLVDLLPRGFDSPEVQRT
jgi:cytidine deaminase